jgi:hypothetical protein
MHACALAAAMGVMFLPKNTHKKENPSTVVKKRKAGTT